MRGVRSGRWEVGVEGNGGGVGGGGRVWKERTIFQFYRSARLLGLGRWGGWGVGGAPSAALVANPTGDTKVAGTKADWIPMVSKIGQKCP